MQFIRKNRAFLWLAMIVPTIALACQIFTPNTPALVPSGPVQTVVVTQAPELSSLPAEVQSEQDLLVNMYTRVNPAVVNITTYAGQGGQVLPLGEGSGFVYDSAGHIVTNAHVVQGADQVEVTFSDGLIRDGEVVGEDLDSDLAVVKVESLPEGVQPLPLGSMEDLAVGQTVIAIGNPFGLEGTLTQGIISALGRTIPALSQFSIPQSIQTDAAINPGNSGGPLLNLQGEVIGVNAQIETGGTSRSNSGVGFAIPVSVLERVIPALIEQGHYEWPWLGVRGSTVTPTLVKAMQLPVEQGAYIAEVLPGGPAEDANLRGASEPVTVEGRSEEIGGDVVTGIDGQQVNTFDDLLYYIALEHRPGDTVELTVLRDGETMTVNVTLEARPQS